MSLVGFKAQNHPQQTGKRGARISVDDRGTDPALWAVLHQKYNFTIDVAAVFANAKLKRFFSPENDGLAQSWRGERVWCNPPYSNLEAWVEKAWREHQYAELIVMLVPANRTEQPWWQRWVEPRRDQPDSPLRVQFLPGRPRFTVPGSPWAAPANARPPFGCCLLIWGAPRG